MAISYAGISDPHRIGAFGVEENAKRLQRFRYIHERLLFAGAAQLPSRHNWDVKVAIGRHLYEDAEAADQLRTRIHQLRSPLPSVGQEPDPALALLMDELLHAASDSEWLAGVYTVIKPGLAKAYLSHMSRTQQVVDQPTVRSCGSCCSILRISWHGGKKLSSGCAARGNGMRQGQPLSARCFGPVSMRPAALAEKPPRRQNCPCASVRSRLTNCPNSRSATPLWGARRCTAPAWG
ncbi:hypothetical protein SD70_02125 [Gordoniibacillus kamchatkensis]|uniref:Uncharacterized protein n=1 Tax=Gordoniibacillus kamchatkensis TaxID=1590651 RepID=A0ABR5AMY1_9BACL|nr:hypothetical protein [Paenibacillus sp. VKM B-2647]KIL42321.1 hypothetical protein SD70_02125 [Paenibacillus sp. VKM B-2647]